MMRQDIFTLEKARRMLPSLREMLTQANDELAEKVIAVRAANECYERAESELDNESDTKDLDRLRHLRAQFQDAIQQLSAAQNGYLGRLNYWVDRITETGVILRDLRDGLLDFPCEENGFAFLLCWKMGEEDINFWHLANDGFIGRKPLSTLSEYY